MAIDSISNSTLTVIAVVVIVELVIKSYALWRAARRNQRSWYIVLLVINTAGVLPLFYLMTHAPVDKTNT